MATRARTRPTGQTMKIAVANRFGGVLPAGISAVRSAAAFFAGKAEALAARRGMETLESVLVVLHGDRASAAAHAAVMGVAGPTDVITLRYCATPAQGAHGELLVNPAEAVRQAERRGAKDGPPLLPQERDAPWSAAHELMLYIAHGFDHLAGSDDAAVAGFRAMRLRELRWLDALGL